jgi:hypothetical protein
MKSILLATALIATSAPAATLYTEAVSGEVSDDFSNPTEILLTTGTNTLVFTIGGGAIIGGAPNGTGGATNGSDADFFELIIPFSTSIDSIVVRESEGGIHFFAAEFGPGFSFRPVNSSSSDFFANLDAATTFRRGTELVNFIGDPRLPLDVSRDISLLFQETGIERSSVTIDVHVVPEPETMILIVLATSLSACRRHRRPNSRADERI